MFPRVRGARLRRDISSREIRIFDSGTELSIEERVKMPTTVHRYFQRTVSTNWIINALVNDAISKYRLKFSLKNVYETKLGASI